MIEENKCPDCGAILDFEEDDTYRLIYCHECGYSDYIQLLGDNDE